MSLAVIYLVHGNDLIEMFHNSVRSLRTAGFEGSVIAYTSNEDTDALEEICKNTDVEMKRISLDTASVPENYHNIGSKEFAFVSWHKFQIIKDALAEHELVIFSDCDIVYFRDPAAFIANAARAYPMGGQSDCFDSFPQHICTGFLFFRREESVTQLLDHCFTVAIQNMQNGKFIGHDQQVFNLIFKNNGRFYASFCFLSEYYFPNGASYKNFSAEALDYSVSAGAPYLFHANYVVGLENKKRLLQHVGGWVLE